MWEIYVFDMDGTVIDAMKEHADIFSKMLHKKYVIPFEKSIIYYHTTAGQPLDEQFRGCIKLNIGIDERKSNIINLVNYFWNELSMVKAISFPTVQETLLALKDKGKKLVISSGCTPQVVRAKLISCNLSQYFHLMLGTEYEKPDMRKGVAHFNIIKKQFNLSEEDIYNILVVIGDAAHDIIIGKSFGASTIGVLNKYNRNDITFLSADFIISRINEILKLPSCSGKQKFDNTNNRINSD